VRVGLLLLLALTACTTPDPVRFQYYAGNESLPPEHQYVTVLRANVLQDRIAGTLSTRHGEMVMERPFVLTGEDLEDAMRVIRHTSVEEIVTTDGGDVIEVTFTAADGTERFGQPSNPYEWDRLIERVRQLAGMSGGG